MALSNVPPVYRLSVASSVTSRDVAAAQRVNVSGDQRAAADGGAAGIGKLPAFRISVPAPCSGQRCAVPAGGAGGIERGVNVSAPC